MNISFAIEKDWARVFPIPADWEPCPGKTNETCCIFIALD
jgi:hypothetical protein